MIDMMMFACCVCMCQVRTKIVPQCVEFYYLNKKLHDKREKQKEEENRHCDLEQQTNVSTLLEQIQVFLL